MASELLIYGALKVGTSKGGRKVVGGILGVVLLLLIVLIAAFGSLFSVFTGSDGFTKDFNVLETQVYKDVRAYYDEYIEDVKEEMDDLEEKYKKQHMATYLVSVVNPVTNLPELVEVEYCAAVITKSFSYVPSAYVLAYLSVKHQEEYLKNKKNIVINEGELVEFWNTVSAIQVESDVEEYPKYFISNPVMDPEHIASVFFASAATQKQYLESVYQIGQFIGIEFADENNIFVDTESRMGIPLYYQYEEPWGRKKYGTSNISKSGCAPTCIAMVFSYLKHTEITPADIVDFTGNRYYVDGAGSSWGIFSGCAKRWNIKCDNIGTNATAIVSALENQQPVILSMGPGKFTTSGHFIVLTGIDKEGKVSVNDPNDNNRKNHLGQKFSLQQVLREAKGGWSFE